MRVLISTGLVGLLSFGTVTFAAAEPVSGNQTSGNQTEAIQLGSASKEKFARLECKLFGHSFESDSVEARAVRLETLIFGEEATGSVPARVEKLISLYTAEELAPPPAPKSTAKAPQAAAKGKNPAANLPPEAWGSTAKTQQKPVETGSLNDEENRELSDYPRITALENAILGKSNEGQPLSARMNAMESKAFGAPSNLPDFARRTEALENYAEKTLHKKVVASAGPLYQQEQPPLPRQKSAAGEPSTQAGAARPAAGSRSAGVSKAVVATVANTLLGATGMGGLGMLPAAAMGLVPRLAGRAAPPQAPPTASEPSSPGDDFFAGPGSAEAAAAAAAAPAEDLGPPPPDSARLLVKVGWCEKQIFGQSFPQLHLTERLRQLSQELKFETSKSDFELMDDIGGMIKTVQARQKAKPIGQTPQATAAVQ